MISECPAAHSLSGIRECLRVPFNISWAIRLNVDGYYEIRQGTHVDRMGRLTGNITRVDLDLYHMGE